MLFSRSKHSSDTLEKYCPCSRTTPMDIALPVIRELAVASVNYINDVKLKSHQHLCMTLELKTIIRAELEELQAILVNADASAEEKNLAYEKIKNINNIRTEEEKLENIIKDTFNLKAFVKINGDQIRVVISSDKHDTELANNIIRKIQENYEQNKYISVKFQV